jgi:hypothetical protein
MLSDEAIEHKTECINCVPMIFETRGIDVEVFLVMVLGMEFWALQVC